MVICLKPTGKTRRAREIHKIIESGLTQSTKLKFLIFGPAEGKSGYKSHREAIRNLIMKMGQSAAFPEDFKSNLVIHTGSGIRVKSPILMEHKLIKDFDYTIIVMISLGSIVEFSVYFMTRFSHKIRLFVPRRFTKSTGFVSCGPIAAFKNVHRQVYYFNYPNDLMQKVKKVVKHSIVLSSSPNALSFNLIVVNSYKISYLSHMDIKKGSTNDWHS